MNRNYWRKEHRWMHVGYLSLLELPSVLTCTILPLNHKLSTNVSLQSMFAFFRSNTLAHIIGQINNSMAKRGSSQKIYASYDLQSLCWKHEGVSRNLSVAMKPQNNFSNTSHKLDLCEDGKMTRKNYHFFQHCEDSNCSQFLILLHNCSCRITANGQPQCPSCMLCSIVG